MKISVTKLESLIKNIAYKKLQEALFSVTNQGELEASDKTADQLYTYIINDKDLYQTQALPIRKTLLKKIMKNVYDPDGAVRLWTNLVDLAVKKYEQETKDYPLFTKQIRVKVAEVLAQKFEEKVKSGQITPAQLGLTPTI